MALLTDEERKAAWSDLMRGNDGAGDFWGSLTKQDLRAAVDAVDGWLDANAASMNTAIPEPARGAMTAKQKARLLVHLVERRFLQE